MQKIVVKMLVNRNTACYNFSKVSALISLLNKVTLS
jgi:hypothetical protein